MNNNSTILIVDDDQIGRDTLEALLAKQNYNLAFANNGAEALAKAKELTPDVILLDVMMPGMDGFEVCRHLRDDSILAEVPIIMVTALDDRDSRMQGIEAGADDFITKPFDRGELQMRVRTITRLNRYRRLLVANQQLEVKISQLSALYNISSALNSTIDIDALLKSIIQKTAELLNAESVSIYFSNQANGGFPQVAGWVFREGKSALVQDISKDERFCLETEANKSLSVGSVLCVPLQGKDGVLGVLEAVNKKDSEFIQDDQRMLEAMADNIAVSIEKANLYQDLQRAEALLRRQNAALRLSVKQKYSFANIIGNSDELIDVLKKAEQVALTDSTVLIYGETGTGKELLAQAIHQISPMKIIAVLCALLFALPAWAGTLRDDFSDGNFDGWTPISFVEEGGQWTVEEGKLVITRSSVWSGGLVIGEEDWKDYSIEFDATLHTKLANFSLIALALRLKGNAQQWRNVWMNYGVSPEGTSAGIAAYDHPNWLQEVKKPMPFEIGKTYHLKGVVSGNKYQLYIDKELVLQIQENRFPSGKARLDVNGAIVSFDNVVITGDEVPDRYLSVKPSGNFPSGKLPIVWARLKML